MAVSALGSIQDQVREWRLHTNCQEGDPQWLADVSKTMGVPAGYRSKRYLLSHNGRKLLLILLTGKRRVQAEELRHSNSNACKS